VKQGTYIWRIKKLHEKYGPIIRISPNALHINDPDFYDVYSGKVGEKRDKYPWAMPHFNTPQAIVATVEHNHHRLRRGAVAQFFSKANIRRLDYVLKGNVKKFLGRLQEFEESGEPVNILDGFKALTSDVLTAYAFGESHCYLDVKDFNKPFWSLFQELSHNDAFTNHFPWFLPVVTSFPDWMQRLMGMEYVMAFEKVLSPSPRVWNLLNQGQKSRGQLQAMIDNKDLDEKDMRTLFRDLLNSSLPPEEKSIERMWHDGQVFNIAGSETTSWTLANATFYLLSNPEILRRVQDEIKTVTPDGSIDGISAAELEALPYLVGGISAARDISF
jgi:cytochrome P450